MNRFHGITRHSIAGAVTTRSTMARSPGTERRRAGVIQEPGVRQRAVSQCERRIDCDSQARSISDSALPGAAAPGDARHLGQPLRKGALLPVELTNGLVSLSTYPSACILGRHIAAALAASRSTSEQVKSGHVR